MSNPYNGNATYWDRPEPKPSTIWDRPEEKPAKEWFARVMDRRRALQEIEECPPFTIEVTMDCEDCGGTGRDQHSLEFEYCPAAGCIDGKVKVMRQYLAEAFRIAAGEAIPVEKGHLVALTVYARQTVSALMAAKEAA
jgi:hypothetical protein